MFSAGFDTEGLSSAVWPGGETEALTRLERHLERKVSKFRFLRLFLVCYLSAYLSSNTNMWLCCEQAWVANFERPRMNANSLLASPTGLSPYLRFGCLSCRLFYFKLTDLYRKVKESRSGAVSDSLRQFLFPRC